MKRYLLLLLAFIYADYCLAQGSEFYSKALEYKKIDNYTEVIRQLKKAIELEPGNFEYQTELAEAFYIKKSYHEALRAYLDLQKVDGGNNFYKLRITEMFAASNKFNEAIESSKEINLIQLDIENQSKFYSSLGNSYYRINHFPSALETYKKMLDLGHGNLFDINYKIAKCYVELNSFDKATEYYEASIDNVKKDGRRVLEVGINYFNAAKFDKAIEYYLLAAEYGAPQSLNYFFNLSNIYFEKKDYKNALVYLKKSKELSPFDQDVASLTAYSHYLLGATNNARDVIEEMLKINPENGDLIYLMGMTYQKDGKMDKAEKYFEKSFKAKPQLEILKVSMMKL
jgi:tetratricopeptide (TPR) repeat protein